MKAAEPATPSGISLRTLAVGVQLQYWPCWMLWTVAVQRELRSQGAVTFYARNLLYSLKPLDACDPVRRQAVAAATTVALLSLA